MELLKVPQGEFGLSRYPKRKNELLRAWDAADEYLLTYFYENGPTSKQLSILVINDSFGALATALNKHTITVWTDSWLAEEGIKQNISENKLPNTKLKIVSSIETPEGNYDVVFIKIPKSLSLLEDQLIRIKPLISKSTKIIAAGMVKSIHISTLKLFEKLIGSTKTSLAKKKARLIFSTVDENIPLVKSPYPKKYTLEGTSYSIVNHANVFSRESLDIGTRFFIQHIPQSGKYKSIIDLGCGNGIVGLLAAEKNPHAVITFTDESFMAVESAKETFALAFDNQRSAQFMTNDCLAGLEKNSADLILNNPPFHQSNAIGDEVAWQMFKQSKDVLKQNGELWVIGNRHLSYHIKLKKIFGNCERVASNKKFVILKSIKR
ncbi:MAG: methyltransferase [Gammaproteobacteria bacterium]|nr:methyltransferase [Gammaproteobacteria bacterium]